ncbi:hypothetical protein CMI45_01320 [Candidatus Pacearchaeota archaeon]|nr:hypothetical protein [Candidatus Pacearchaeota archaeon]|tara:strand:- start:644 stop:1510 length:867 start_codon:yes stop_codon:yes gene_type:complete
MRIFTHRGLEPSKEGFYPESSYEAFREHLRRGYGIEFDVNFCKDGLIVFHDSGLERITRGKDSRKFSDMTMAEVAEIRYGNPEGRIASLGEVLELISNSGIGMNAMHLKGSYQNREKLDKLTSKLIEKEKVLARIFVFDVKPRWAMFINSKIPGIKLAPSVAHDHDIERYNYAVNGTLLSVEDALEHKDRYDWVWLDEWDLSDTAGKKKKLYTRETFDILRETGYKIALVTPDLHGTSPGLLGREAHPDAENKERLFSRIKEIVALQPDGICTDFPEEVLNIIRSGEY